MTMGISVYSPSLSTGNSLINLVFGAATLISEAFLGSLDSLVNEAILPSNASFSKTNVEN